MHDTFVWAADLYGCGMYRCVLPTICLRAQGYPVTVGQVLTPEAYEAADVLITQRAVGNDALVARCEQARSDGKTVIAELDDDLFSIEPSNEAYALLHQPGVQANVKRWLRASNAAIVTNQTLATVVAPYVDRTYVIPNFVPLALLSAPRTDSDTVTIGWGGGPTHVDDVPEMAFGLRSVLKAYDRARFLNVGHDFRSQLDVPGAFVPWTTDLFAYYATISQFDISLAPLRKSRFNASRSYIKALEAAALGVPTIASNFGPYPDFIDHGVTGFLASNVREWRDYLHLLVEDDSLRQLMGEAARLKARDHTFEGNAWRWASAIEDACLDR